MPESSRMTESYSLSELEAIIRRVTDSGGEFELYPKGTSMLPLILEGRDSVILSCLPDELTAGDVVLYRRDDGSYVLHRIIGCDGGTYTMCGDNQYNAEPGIRRDQMIAFASAFIINGKRIEADSPENLRYIKHRRSLKLRRIYLPVIHRLRSLAGRR